MKMSPEEVELTLRDISACLLRSYIVHCGSAVLRLEPRVKMAGVGEKIVMPVEDILRFMEDGYRRDTIPAPTAAKEKTRATFVRINAELEQLLVEVFASEHDEPTPVQVTEQVPRPARQEVSNPFGYSPQCGECDLIMNRNNEGEGYCCAGCGKIVAA